MNRVATAWKWLLAKAREGRPQLLLCLRVTVAAVASYVLAQFFAVPLAGLWAVLTAVVVTQTSVGGSLTAAIEYSFGTLGGAIYAGVVGALIPYHNELSLLAVLALAIAPWRCWRPLIRIFALRRSRPSWSLWEHRSRTSIRSARHSIACLRSRSALSPALWSPCWCCRRVRRSC